MGRRTFKNWFEAYKKLCYKKGLNDNHVKTLDAEAFKETYFDDGLTIEEAYQEEIYHSN